MKINLSHQEKQYLRELAKKVKDIADNDVWEEKRQLWTDLVKLQGKRTMVMSVYQDDIWNELLTPEKTLVISDSFFRELEYDFLKRIYRWEHLKDDTVLNDIVYIPIDYKFTDWMENRIRPGEDVENLNKGLRYAGKYHPCIVHYSDLKKLKLPELSYINMSKTDAQVDMVSDVLGDILHIVKGEPFAASSDSSVFGWGRSIIDVLCELRGLEQVYYDIYDAPEFMHEAMSFLQKGYMNYLDTMEKEHLLFLNNTGYMNHAFKSEMTAIGENGLGITDILPPKDFDPENIRTKDLWGYFMEQEFEPISPEHRYEFVMKYQQPIAARFGMIAYGCCENNDKSYEYMFKTFPNLRFVSVPFVSNLSLAAQKLKNHVMSWRPLSTLIDDYDDKRVRDAVDRSLDIMKDNNSVYLCSGPMTLKGRNDSISRWIDHTMELSRYYARK